MLKFEETMTLPPLSVKLPTGAREKPRQSTRFVFQEAEKV